MRVTITEKKLKDAGYNLVHGDTLTVDNALGAKWCQLGWAQDADGVVPTGERIPGARALDVQNTKVSKGAIDG